MKRNKSLDGLKFLLIVLVVIGHFIEPSRYNNLFSCKIYSLIYSFHMPLFIWLNGFFYKYRPFKEELKKSLPLIEVCLISHFLFLFFLFGKISILYLIDYSYSPSWYLLSFVSWRLVSSLALSKMNSNLFLLFSIFLELITFILIPKYGGMFSFMRTFQFLPFFVLGYTIKDRVPLLFKYNNLIFLLGLFSIVFIIVSSNKFQHQCLFERSSLYELLKYTNHSVSYVLLFRYLLVFCSLFISCLVFLLTFKNQTILYFANAGQRTLFVYFGQTLLYPFAIKYCNSLYISLLASIIVLIMLTYLSSKTISRLIMNPISSFLYSLQKN